MALSLRAILGGKNYRPPADVENPQGERRAAQSGDAVDVADSPLAQRTLANERIYLKAHAAAERLRKHKQDVLDCAPSPAKLRLFQFLSVLLVLSLITACICSSHPMMWVLLALVLVHPQKVFRVSSRCVGSLPGEPHPHSEPEAAEPNSTADSSPRKRQELSVRLSAWVDGTDPEGTVYLCRRVYALLCGVLCTTYAVAISLFQLILASNSTVREAYDRNHDAWRRSVQWAVFNASGTHGFELNSTLRRDWVWPPFETFGMWDASGDLSRFVTYLIPVTAVAAVGWTLFGVLPKRFYYGFNSAAQQRTTTRPLLLRPSSLRSDDDVESAKTILLGDRRPNAVMEIERGYSVSISSRPVARSGVVAATCLPIFLSTALLPGLCHVLPLCLAVLYAWTCTMAPPSPDRLMPPTRLVEFRGEGQKHRRLYFSRWVVLPSNDRATWLRSKILTALHASICLVIVLQCVWQSVLFEGWNELDGSSDTQRLSWTLHDRTSEEVTSLWTTTTQSSWYRVAGLYNLRQYLEVDSASHQHASELNVTSSQQGAIGGAHPLGAFVATADSSGRSIVVRLILQMLLYGVAWLWTQGAPASIYHASNEDVQARMTPEEEARSAQRSALFKSHAAKVLLTEDQPVVLTLKNSSVGQKSSEAGAEDDEQSSKAFRTLPELFKTLVSSLVAAVRQLRRSVEDISQSAAYRPADGHRQDVLVMTVERNLEVAHTVLHQLSGLLLQVSPWASLASLAIVTVVLPSMVTLVVFVPAVAFLAVGSRRPLLTGRVCAAVSVVVSTYLLAVVVYISLQRFGRGVHDPRLYYGDLWSWFVILGTPFSPSLAEYSLITAALGICVVCLTFAYLLCVDEEVVVDLRLERQEAERLASERLRRLATRVVTVFSDSEAGRAAFGAELTTSELRALVAEQPSLPAVAQLVPELAGLHPLHRTVLLTTGSDSESWEVMSHLWRLMHILRAHQRIPSSEWSQLTTLWAELDRKYSVVSLRDVVDSSIRDPTLKSLGHCCRALPLDVVRVELLPQLASVRWTLSEEELLFLLDMLDQVVPPGHAIRHKHWNEHAMYIEDAALILGVFAGGSQFLRSLGDRLTRLTTSVDDVRSFNAAVETVIDRTDAWRLLKLLRAVSSLEGGATFVPTQQQPDDSNPSVFFTATSLTKLLRDSVGSGNASFVDPRSPDSRDSWVRCMVWFRACCDADLGGWQLELVHRLAATQVRPDAGDTCNAISVTAAGNVSPPAEAALLGADSFSAAPPQLKFDGPHYNVSFAVAGRPSEAAGAAAFSLRQSAVNFDLESSMLAQSSLSRLHDSTTVRPDAVAAPKRAKDFSVLRRGTHLVERCLLVCTSVILVVLGFLWHTLALSSFIAASLMFWLAAYRRVFTAIHVCLLFSSLWLVFHTAVGTPAGLHRAVVACSAVVLIALCATMIGTIFRYTFAAVGSTDLSLPIGHESLHSDVLYNIGVASVEANVWELSLYWGTFFYLQVQRYAFFVEERKDKLVAWLRAGRSNTALRAGSVTSRAADGVSWTYIQQAVHWRVLQSSTFFIRTQFFLCVVVVAALYMGIVGFDHPSWLSVLFLLMYLIVVVAGSSHRDALQSKAFQHLLAVVGVVSGAVVLALGVLHVPALHHAINTGMLASFRYRRGVGLVGRHCGIARLISEQRSTFGGMSSDNVERVIARNVTYWGPQMVTACIGEVGFGKDGGDDAAMGRTIVPYFFAVLFCAVQHWLLSTFANRKEGDREPAGDTKTSAALSRVSTCIQAVYRAAVVLVGLTQHNIVKVLWIADLFAATNVICLLTVPYLLFLLFDITGGLPIVYAAMHLIVIHGYDLSALPVFASGPMLQLIGLAKTMTVTYRVTPSNSTIVGVSEGGSVSVTQESMSLDASITAGPILVLVFHMLYRNSASIADALRDDVPTPLSRDDEAASRSPSASSLRNVLTMAVVFLYAEVVRSFSWEWLSLAVLVGVAVNDIRAVQVLFLATWMVLRVWGRDGFIRSAPVQRSLLVVYSLALAGVVFLGLPIPLDGTDPSGGDVVRYGKSIEDDMFLAQMFFWPSLWVQSFYSVKTERYSYAKYLGAQPDAGLFWCLGVVIMLIKLMRRDQQHHSLTPPLRYNIRSKTFGDAGQALRALQRPMAMARSHLLRLFVLLKPKLVAPRAVDSEQVSLMGLSPTVDDASSPAAEQKRSLWHTRSNKILRAVFGSGALAPLDDTCTSVWEDALLRAERLQREKTPVHEQLHLSFARHGVAIWSCLKFFALAYVPPLVLFGDANSNESVLHLILLVLSLLLLHDALRMQCFWTPYRFLPRILAFYELILTVSVVCNIPSVAKYIETYSQPFRALGLTHRRSFQAESTVSETIETTMQFTAWRVAAMWVCLLQHRLSNHFAYFGLLAAIQDAAVGSRDTHHAMLEAVRLLEERERAAVARRGADRAALLKKLHEYIDVERINNDNSSIASQPQFAQTLRQQLPDDVLVRSEDSDRGGDTGFVESWITRLESLCWQVDVVVAPESSPLEKAPLLSARVSSARGASSEPRPAWRRLLASIVRVISLRLDVVVVAFLSANFIQSGSTLDAMPLIMTIAIGLCWYPWPPHRFARVALQVMAVIVLLKAVTRFIVGQTVISPDVSRVLGALLLQMPADMSLQTVTSSYATRTKGPKEALTDMGLDFVSMVALFLYLRVGEVNGLFDMNEDLSDDAFDVGNPTSSEDDESDDDVSSRSTHVSDATDKNDEDVVAAADAARTSELAQLENDIREYEALLEANTAIVSFIPSAPASDSNHPDDASVSRSDGGTVPIDAHLLVELVRSAARRRLRLPHPSAPPQHRATELLQEDGAPAEENFEAKARRYVLALCSNIESKAGTGRDVYTWTVVLESVSLVYIAFAYHSLAGIVGSFVGSIMDNLMPGWLVLWLILSVLIMVADRAIYVISARNFVLAQRLKYLLHWFLTLFYVCFYISWCASRSTDRNFAAGGGLMALKLLYLMISAYQLRHGFPTFKRHDPMTSSPRWDLVYKVYRAVPFLWEIRMLIDWTCARTTLSFKQFLRVEDVHHEVYEIYCDAEDAPKKRGSIWPMPRKLVKGGILFLVAMFAIFFPLMYYSTFNPSLTPNLVTGAVIQIEVDAHGVLYSGSARTTETIGTQLSKALALLFPSLITSSFIGTDSDVQLLSWGSCSENRWPTTLPLRQQLTALLSEYSNSPETPGGLSAPKLKLRTDLDRDRVISSDGSSTVGTLQYAYSLTRAQCADLAAAVNRTIAPSPADQALITSQNGEVGRAFLRNFVVPFVRNTGAAFDTGSAESGTGSAYSCTLILKAEYSDASNTSALTGEYYWCMECQPLLSTSNNIAAELSSTTAVDDAACLLSSRPSVCAALLYEDWTSTLSLAKPVNVPAYVVVSSQQIPATSALPINVGIVALYVTFILSIASLLRDMFSGSAVRAMIEEMLDPKPLADILTYLYMCRGGGDALTAADPELEEALFFELVDLLRAPDALRTATGLRSSSYDAVGNRVAVRIPPMWKGAS